MDEAKVIKCHPSGLAVYLGGHVVARVHGPGDEKEIDKKDAQGVFKAIPGKPGKVLVPVPREEWWLDFVRPVTTAEHAAVVKAVEAAEHDGNARDQPQAIK